MLIKNIYIYVTIIGVACPRPTTRNRQQAALPLFSQNWLEGPCLMPLHRDRAKVIGGSTSSLLSGPLALSAWGGRAALPQAKRFVLQGLAIAGHPLRNLS